MIYPLPSLKISWNNVSSELRFKWEPADFPGDARFVTAYSVDAQGNPDGVITKPYDVSQSKDYNNMRFSLPWQPVMAELQIPRFLVCASTYSNELRGVDPATYQRVKTNPAYYASVVTGSCQISWRAKEKKAGGLKLVKLSLESSLQIPAGFLGYRVTGAGAADIRYPFPFDIPRGKMETPEICVRADQGMEPVILRPELVDNIRLQKNDRSVFSFFGLL